MKSTRTSKIKVLDQEKRKFSTGAQRQASKGKGMPSLISPLAFDALARHCEGGIEAGYAPRNWEKGLPLSSIIDSLLRHVYDELEGLTDENHAAAFLWNAMVYVHTKEAIRRGILPKELDDMPSYIPKKCPKHPDYKAMKPPQSDCDICRMIYENKKDC